MGLLMYRAQHLITDINNGPSSIHYNSKFNNSSSYDISNLANNDDIVLGVKCSRSIQGARWIDKYGVWNSLSVKNC